MEQIKKIVEGQTFDEERALYASRDITVKNCRFDGPADGESAFKESRNVRVEDCFFNLRYPFWHDAGLEIDRCELTELCRAALWYTDDTVITDTKLHGIKALRECNRVEIRNSDIISPEFGWRSHGIAVQDTTATGEYFCFEATDLRLSGLTFKGKYSFQYVENAVIENCVLDTKDAFWHAKNVTVRNSVVKGEYLAWYSEGLTLDHCKIIGTQPLCYCKNLTLIDCEMVDTDLSFERSEVEATVTSHVVSVKNPLKGTIRLPSVGELIFDIDDAKGEVIVG